ncbi:hypothetical protein Pelo_2279 [Pelomyxa schiedti]|nr:hypothetical protein Pelo_2279 [Pelomyxa schiedti]
MAFDFITNERDLHKIYPKVDVTDVREITVRRIDPQILYHKDKDVPNVLRQAVQNILTTAAAGNWGAARVEKPRSLFVWEIIRAMSVASCSRLTSITFAENLESSQLERSSLDEIEYEHPESMTHTQTTSTTPTSQETVEPCAPTQVQVPQRSAAPPPMPQRPSQGALGTGHSGSDRLLAFYEEQLKRGGSCNTPSEFVLRSLCTDDVVANKWAISLIVEMKDVKDEASMYPLIAKLVCAWQMNAKIGITRPVRGCLSTFETWWFCEYRPGENCSVELPCGSVVTRNPLEFATVEMPYGPASGPKGSASKRWEFVPYAGVMDVIGILRDTLLPDVRNFKSSYEEGIKNIREAAKKGVARAKTFYDTDSTHLFRW